VVSGLNGARPACARARNIGAIIYTRATAAREGKRFECRRKLCCLALLCNSRSWGHLLPPGPLMIRMMSSCSVLNCHSAEPHLMMMSGCSVLNCHSAEPHLMTMSGCSVLNCHSAAIPKMAAATIQTMLLSLGAPWELRLVQHYSPPKSHYSSRSMSKNFRWNLASNIRWSLWRSHPSI
jgi:hypothetical protein